MNWKKPAYWTLAFLVLAFFVLALGTVDQPLNALQTTSNNTTGVTP